MRELYLLGVSIHVLAAVFWIGGMLFFAIVGAPALRRIESPGLRADLFRRLGEGFRGTGWIAIGLLLTTGTANLWFGGVLRTDVIGNPAFWLTPYGRALAWKLGAITAMLVVSGLHDFVLGPAASRCAPGSPGALRVRRRAALLARGNTVLGVIIVMVAVRLARGG
jgi:putative copper export protein